MPQLCCHVLLPSEPHLAPVSVVNTQIADPLLRTWAQTVQKARMAVQKAADGQWPFSCCCWLPLYLPDFNLAIDQTNKRRPSILTRQISHHRSSAGFRIANLGRFHRRCQGWISMGLASRDFTLPSGPVFDVEGTYMTTGRKEIGRKMCKAGRACGPGTESWERNSAGGSSSVARCGLGKVTPWGNHCFTLLCTSNGKSS